MGKENLTKIKNSVWLIWLCWLVYMCSYIGKVNYAANINPIMESFKVDEPTAGLVSTFFFFAYGVGQVVHGLLCKKYNLKWMIFISLITSGIANLLVGLTTNFDLIKFLWLINGFSMSVLWPSLIRLLSETLSKKNMPKASLTMGTTVAIGTFIVYALSAVFVKIDFRLIFYIATVVFLLVGLIWIMYAPGLIVKVKAEEESEETIVEEKKEIDTASVNKSFIMLSIVILGFYGVATNLLKDGLTTWIPTILKSEYKLDDSLSIILTLALPIVAIFGNAFAIAIHKKIPDFVMQCAAVFLCAGLIIGGVIAGMALDSFLITLIGFTIVCFLASSCNSVITSIFPLFMKGKVNSGLIAGILNGCCYIGSTISSYGLGWIARDFGWSAVFWALLAVCAVVCVGAVVYILIKKSMAAKLKESNE